MAANEYEPSAEAVEALEDTIRQEFDSAPGRIADSWTHLARFILRRQHEREYPLMCWIESARRALYHGSTSHADDDLKDAQKWYVKLDAKPEPTLAELVKACNEGEIRGGAVFIEKRKWDAVLAAVEREERPLHPRSRV